MIHLSTTYPALLEMIEVCENNQKLVSLNEIRRASGVKQGCEPKRFVYLPDAMRLIFSKLAKNQFKNKKIIEYQSNGDVLVSPDIAKLFLERVDDGIKLAWLCKKNNLENDGQVQLWNFDKDGNYIPIPFISVSVRNDVDYSDLPF